MAGVGEGGATASVGTPKPTRRADRRREDGRLDDAGGVDDGAARVAGLDEPAQLGHPPGAAAVEAGGDRRPDPSGPGDEGAVLGVAEDRGRGARRGPPGRAAAGRVRPGTSSTATSFSAVDREDAAPACPSTRIPLAPATTWAAVTTRSGCGDPARALDARARRPRR